MSNSKERESRYLKKLQIADLIDAAAFADWQEMPLTRWLTFNLKGLEDRPQQFISSFFKLSGDWLRTRGVPRAQIWVLEHPPSKSLNAHCLVHVPSGLIGAFQRKERRWMRGAGYPWQKGRLQSEIIADRGNKKRGPLSPGELLANVEGALGYILKGGEPDACEALVIDHFWQGNIRGKRCGVSQSISKAARSAKGYRAPTGTRGSMLFRWRCRLSN